MKRTRATNNGSFRNCPSFLLLTQQKLCSDDADAANRHEKGGLSSSFNEKEKDRLGSTQKFSPSMHDDDVVHSLAGCAKKRRMPIEFDRRTENPNWCVERAHKTSRNNEKKDSF